MLRHRSFRFWAWLNAGLWVVSFAAIYYWISIAFNDTDPMSSSFKGLTSDAVSDIRTAILQIYLPYLGLILSSAVTMEVKKKEKGAEMEGLLPILIVSLGLFFQSNIALTIYNFIHHPPPEYESLLKDLQVFAAALAFFMAAALSYFYDIGWMNGPKNNQPEKGNLSTETKKGDHANQTGESTEEDSRDPDSDPDRDPGHENTDDKR